MVLSNPRFVLIFGAIKTGTTTATAIANAALKSHVLFEVDFAADASAGRNQEFVTAFPNTRPLFNSGVSYRRAFTEALRLNLALSEAGARVFGSKIPQLDAARIPANRDMNVIVTVRDIRTWICKNAIIKECCGGRMDVDLVPLIVRYCDFFLASFAHERALRLRMEDLPRENGNFWARRIGAYLGLPFDEVANWWEKRAEIWERTSYITWAAYHDSSFVRPGAFDTVSELRPHPVWDAVLPIFDKYYGRLDGNVAPAELEADRKILAGLPARLSMTLGEAFSDFKSWMIKTDPDAE